jgi:hypothetical protein
MSDSHRDIVILVAEATAYRAAYKLVLDALGIMIAVHAASQRSSLAEAVEKRLHEKKGEYLFTAPLELSPELQASANQAFQNLFSELSREIVRKVAAG